MTKTLYFVACSALALSLPSTPALAGEPMTAKVHYADLDLRNDAGVANLDRRIKRAVRKVCGGRLSKNLTKDVPIRRCRAETMTRVTPRRDEVILIARSENAGTVQVAALDISAPPRRN